MNHRAMNRRLTPAASLLACLALAGSAWAADPEPKAEPKPAASTPCVVAAEIRAGWGAGLDSVSMAVSSGKTLETPGFSGGLTHGAGFVFKDVPAGEFRVINIKYLHSVKVGSQYVNRYVSFDWLGVPSAGSERGEMPNEMSGTCAGGFIWLGSYKGEKGNLIVPPSIALGDNAITAANAMREVKSQFAGTEWEAKIDKPVAYTPLPKGKNPEGKLDPEVARKAVAAVAGQTRNARAPPSDPGALEATAGTWELVSINGKPLPYLFTANKCTMLNSVTLFKADGTYTANMNMECAGNKFPFPTSGYYGVVGGVVTYAVAVGPPAGNTVTKLSGDTLTAVAGTDTYVSKKK